MEVIEIRKIKSIKDYNTIKVYSDNISKININIAKLPNNRYFLLINFKEQKELSEEELIEYLNSLKGNYKVKLY